MLKRTLYKKMLNWKNKSKGTNALLIEGARRVGKSTITKLFGESEYESFIMIDFVDTNEDIKNLFYEFNNDPDSFFLYLSAYTGVKLFERNSLIIFDEVQAFPKAREAIKNLVADGRYDYMETGSLVSIKENVKNIRIPSEEHSIKMEPISFEEFLLALHEDSLIDLIRKSFDKRTPLPDVIHRKANRYFREYMLVGGMPQAVQSYIDNRDFGKVDYIKRDILDLYRKDISKYAAGSRLKVTSVFDSIPGQLSKHEKKFNISSLNKNARMREYDDALFWLSDAKIINTCFNSTDPNVGLEINQDRSLLKCYMADTGLLVSHAFADSDITTDGVYRNVLLGKTSINEGMLAENIIAQTLKANGYKLYFSTQYDNRTKRSTEIDFLISKPYKNAAMKYRICPIEVKSGNSYSTKSLDKFAEKYEERLGTQYVIHQKQFKIEENRIYLPFYMAFCL